MGSCPGERSQQVQDILDGKATLSAGTQEFHDLWSTLSDEDKDALWNQDQYLGNRDGMHAPDRDHYNRPLLTEHFRFIKSVPCLGDLQYARLDDLTVTASAIEPNVDTGEPRILLGLDDKSGERVQPIVADGNPDTASHVTTYVPGTGSQPAKLEGDMERVDRMTDQAENSGAARPVTIAWMGYDAPPGLGDATQRDFAAAGAPALNAFQDGLRITHEGEPSRNTVLGHSYGTTVVGLSAAEGRTLVADTVVMVASPGAGVDSARDLSLTGVEDGQQYKHVYSTRAENDPTPLYANLPGFVPGVDRHGEDPTETEFGGQVFTSDPGTRTPVVGYSFPSHSEYWEPGSASLVNIGQIIAGNFGEVRYG
ncbi:alpha/beta hydrolase [Nocardia mangyaensis]|uniref:alpha/beta hydrolase n=1 Tax=Nocardia mangyaensis TaxID=2213200 RepID=UPI002676DD6A|nr:alpha/beta hydrolase [Nocardia mangyaensis]MDO3650910.1 alpha/beta hydrolase [Nocardia mangyaensis]